MFSQSKMNEKRVMNEKHIDFTKEYIYFEVSGLIEIDGHTFLNDTCKCPIIYKANIKGITIFNKCNNVKYEYRKCSKKGCNIIHLIEIENIKIENMYQWDNRYFNYIPCSDYDLDNTLKIIQDTLYID